MKKDKEATLKIITTGLMVAIIAICTMVIAIPVPFTNGYVHLGDSMIFLAVLILGWKYGAIAAAVGSAMADAFLGYVHWIPWTFCIKGVMALLVGLVIEKTAKSRRNIVVASLSTAGAWIAFNFVVRWIVKYESTHNRGALIESGVVTQSEFAGFLASVQNQLMIIALLIPVALTLISIYVRIKEHTKIPFSQILGMTLGGLWMVLGYYVAGGVMYGNFAVAAFSIPANMIQFLAGFFLAAIVAATLEKTPAKKFFAYKTPVVKQG
ncbi:MAG: ECF transporter S component [Anaerovoracaceae bacterium]|jgi:uncharacterized membrane protein